MLLGFVIVMLLLVLFAAIATAEPLYARVTYVPGINNIPSSTARRISLQNAAYFSSIGIPVKIRSFRVERGFGSRYTLSEAHEYLGDCEALNINRRYKNLSLYHCIFPPILDNGSWWIAGHAEGVCQKGRYSYSNAESKNPITGALRVYQSMIAQRHEIAHLLGANDSSGCSLMSTGVLYCQNQEISAQSIREINKCVRGW
jgi:hypothetical protein